jgi:hypothetical protein
MIRIGLSEREKQKTLSAYLDAHPEIDRVVVCHGAEFRPRFKVPDRIRETRLDHLGPQPGGVAYISWDETIMYRTFYPLLALIDRNTLVVINEAMRALKRTDLHYNCMLHYLNQTPYRMVFEFFPIIEDKNDMMILFDLEDKSRFYRRPFDYALLQSGDIRIKPFRVSFETLYVETPPEAVESYEKKKTELFDRLGQKDPNTIPRQLQLLAGDVKRPAIDAQKQYVARNGRFNRKNVHIYPVTEPGKYYVLDMHYRRLNFNDFVKQTQQKRVSYLSTTLPVDNVFATGFLTWKARLDAIYAQASIYQ